jgi:hypothetical protein
MAAAADDAPHPPDDAVLSEVHSGSAPLCVDGLFISTFAFRRPAAGPPASPPRGASLDADGDLLVPRRRRGDASQRLSVYHDLATKIEDVGKQVWRGALFLADYALQHAEEFTGANVLELGGGLGEMPVASRALFLPFSRRAHLTHAHAHAHVHTRTHTYTHVHTRTHTNTHKHTHVHTRTHTHTDSWCLLSCRFRLPRAGDDGAPRVHH